MRLTMARAVVAAGLMVFASVGAALAGSEEAPEITDAVGDTSHVVAGQYGDLVAGWVEQETPTEFTVVMKLATLDAMLLRATGYGVAFDHAGVTYYVFAAIDENGRAEFVHGHLDRETVSQRSATSTTGEIKTGAPGYIRIVFHKALLDEPLPEGVVASPSGVPGLLNNFASAAYDFKAYAAYVGDPLPQPPESLVVMDWAEGSLTYALNFTTSRAQEGAGEAVDDPDAVNLTETPAGSDVAGAEGTRADAPLPFALSLALIALVGLAVRPKRRA